MKVTDKITITQEDNMALMARYPDGYFDLAIVDPPYGIGFDRENPTMSAGVRKDGTKRKMASWSNPKEKGYTKKDWDKETPSEEYWKELMRVSKNQIIWGGNYFNLKSCKCFLIWDKLFSDELSFSMYEMAWTSFNTTSKGFKYNPASDRPKAHPTQKPVALYKWLLDKYAKENDKILDTHLGSGSIAIACHDYGFELTACELDTEYYDKSIERIKNHVSQLKIF